MAAPETPKLMVDVVVPDDRGRVLLVRRGSEPYKGRWALPGGFVDIGETTEAAAVREAREETGLDVEVVRLVGVYSDPDRDPRGHNVSCAYLARTASPGDPRGASDADDAAFVDPGEVELAFDHAKVVADALGGTRE